jgi:tetratricopeptide (TPR) repeat protein
MLSRTLALAVGVALLAYANVATQSRSGAQEIDALNEAGWRAVQNRDGGRAAALFGEALSRRPNDAVLLLGAGVAAHLEGRGADALMLLKRAIRLDPTLVEASILLGELAFQDGDVDLAIQTYEAALEHSARDARLARRLEEWRKDADAHRSFEEVRYDRFRVRFEGRADQSLAIRAATLLDNAFRRIGQTLGSFPSQPVIVVLYTEQQFRDVTKAPEWSIGHYDGRVRLPVRGALEDPALFERVLIHELTHAMVSSIAPRGVPAWLHEGLAQHFEGEDPQAAHRRVGITGALPLRLLEGSFSRLNAAQAQVAYDQSLLAVDVMADRPGFGWSNLLRELATGERFEHAIERFGLSYADLDAASSASRR